MKGELILKVLQHMVGDISFAVYQSKAAIDGMYRRKQGVKLRRSAEK
jgi:hypothetical protein